MGGGSMGINNGNFFFQSAPLNSFSAAPDNSYVAFEGDPLSGIFRGRAGQNNSPEWNVFQSAANSSNFADFNTPCGIINLGQAGCFNSASIFDGLLFNGAQFGHTNFADASAMENYLYQNGNNNMALGTKNPLGSNFFGQQSYNGGINFANAAQALFSAISQLTGINGYNQAVGSDSPLATNHFHQQAGPGYESTNSVDAYNAGDVLSQQYVGAGGSNLFVGSENDCALQSEIMQFGDQGSYNYADANRALSNNFTQYIGSGNGIEGDLGQYAINEYVGTQNDIGEQTISQMGGNYAINTINNPIEDTRDNALMTEAYQSAYDNSFNTYNGTNNYDGIQNVTQDAGHESNNGFAANYAADTNLTQTAGDYSQNLVRGTLNSDGMQNFVQASGGASLNRIRANSAAMTTAEQYTGMFGASEYFGTDNAEGIDMAAQYGDLGSTNTIQGGKGALMAKQHSAEGSTQTIDASTTSGGAFAMQDGDCVANNITGSAADDVAISGSNASLFNYNLGAGNDEVTLGGAGNSGAVVLGDGADTAYVGSAVQNGLTIDGGAGCEDSVVFNNALCDYMIEQVTNSDGATGYRVIDRSAAADAEGTYVTGFEQYTFGDQNLTEADLQAHIAQQQPAGAQAEQPAEEATGAAG